MPASPCLTAGWSTPHASSSTTRARADLKVERRVMPRDAAVETFKQLGEHFKARSSPASRPTRTSAYTGRA
jgi:hypothetical protein